MVDELGTGYFAVLDVWTARELVQHLLTAVRTDERLTRPFIFESANWFFFHRSIITCPKGPSGMPDP